MSSSWFESMPGSHRFYKRHLPTCSVHKSRVPKAKRRFWMDCDCPVWIHGRTPTGDIVPRQSTRFSDLKKTEALRASLMAQVQADSISGPPVSECIEKYLATREQDLDARTLAQHRLALERLQRFLEAQNVAHMGHLTVDHPGDILDCRLAQRNAHDEKGNRVRENPVLSSGGLSPRVD